MEEIHLFRVPAGYQATVRLERDGTWTLIFDRFYEGEMWDARDRDIYHQLSLAEAADVVLGEIFTVRP
jgi:hypothetical protein